MEGVVVVVGSHRIGHFFGRHKCITPNEFMRKADRLFWQDTADWIQKVCTRQKREQDIEKCYSNAISLVYTTVKIITVTKISWNSRGKHCNVNFTQWKRRTIRVLHISPQNDFLFRKQIIPQPTKIILKRIICDQMIQRVRRYLKHSHLININLLQLSSASKFV